MGLLDDFLESTGLNLFGDSLNALGDSLGLTQHGRDQYFQREMQQDFLNQQQDFQREMTANQQDFTREMYDKQWQDQLTKYPMLQKQLADIQFNQWRQQFNAQNAYNSYGNQISRAMASGINPNSLYGSSGSIATSSMSPLAAQAPPQISPTPFQSHASPIGLPSGFSNPRSVMSEIGSFLKDIGQAKKLGVETDQLLKLFDYEVEERTQRIFGQRLTNDSISLANYVSNLTKDIKVKQATQDLLQTIAATKNLDEDTMLKLEKIFTERTQQLLHVAQSRLTDEQYELVKLRVDNFQTEFKTTMANLRADTAKKQSETRLNNAIRETENQLRDGRVLAQDLANTSADIGNDLLRNDLYISNRTMDAKINGLIHSWEREGILNQQEAQKLYQLQVSSDWAERREFIGYVGATAQAIGNVLGGLGSAVSGAASWKNAQWNNLNYKEKNQIMREVGTERNRILNEYQKQATSAHRSAVLGPDWEMYSDQWHQ